MAPITLPALQIWNRYHAEESRIRNIRRKRSNFRNGIDDIKTIKKILKLVKE